MRNLVLLLALITALNVSAGDSDWKYESKPDRVATHGRGTPCMISIVNGGVLAVVTVEGKVWLASQFRGRVRAGLKPSLTVAKAAAFPDLSEYCSGTIELMPNDEERRTALALLASFKKK